MDRRDDVLSGTASRHIRDLIATQPRTFSFEFFPPKTPAGVEHLMGAAAELRELHPSFVSVTYGAGGSNAGRWLETVGRLQDELGLTGMGHLTCVGHTRDQLRERLETMWAKGIVNVLALRGDPPPGQDHFEQPPDGCAHAIELVQLAKSVADFSVVVAGFPEIHPDAESAERDLEFLKQKVDAGADLVITQLFYKNSHYFDFMERAAAIGLEKRVVPGIMPITNWTQIKRIAELAGADLPGGLTQQLAKAADDDAECYRIGVDFATEQCVRLLECNAPGIHFYTLNKSRATQDIFRNLQQSGVAALLPVS